MEFWTDIYPHKVWINILTFKGEYLDFKIGKDKRDWGTWTMRWDSNILQNKDCMNVVSTFIEVHNSEEHNRAFEIGNEFVESYIKLFGKYKFKENK